MQTNAKQHNSLPPFTLQRREVIAAIKGPSVGLRRDLPRPQRRLRGVLDALHEPRRRPFRTGKPGAQRRVRHAAPVSEVALGTRPTVGNEPLHGSRQVVAQCPRTGVRLRQTGRVNVGPVRESVSRCRWESHGVDATGLARDKHSGGNGAARSLGRGGWSACL